jgi:7-cyano-7-deazaguanine synthase in queuosine biosynthesis
MITDRAATQRPLAHIIATDQARQARSSALTCIIGQDLVVLPKVLGTYCVHELTARVDDLVILAGVVAFADRAVARTPASAWPRALHLTLPVHDRAFWERNDIILALTQTLDALTGDTWDFAFKPRTKQTRVNPQTTLPLSGQPCTVIPFSDGLDSLAVARLTQHHTPDTTLLLVTTGTHRSVALDARARRVAIPFKIPSKRVRFPETSYRSRAFVFGVMAGIAAHLVGAHRIVVPESGQSSLGPWLLPVGNEAPDIRTHPLFTARLATFLSAVLGTTLCFDHPQLWKTKGETLRELHDLGLHDQWWMTRSCPRRRHVSLDGNSVQCGVCAACLLRRQSLHAAGLDEGKDRYFWADLGAPTLAQAAPHSARTTGQNDTRHAWCGTLELENLATYACNDNYRFSRATAELAEALGISNATACHNFTRLLGAHAAEWKAFVASLAGESFLVRWLQARQC